MGKSKCVSADQFVRISTYRVPFGGLPLLLEFGEFATIVDGRQDFPQEQQRQAKKHNRRNHSHHNAQDEHLRRALQLFLGYHLDVVNVVVIVGELKFAVILVVEHTQMVVVLLVHFQFLDALRHEQRAVGRAQFRIVAHRPGLVDLALDAFLELLAPARARRALFAVFARKAALGRLLALAPAAHAIAVARANLAAIRRHARVLRYLARAIVAGPARLAAALAALADAVVDATAQHTVDAVAREVVALAVLAGDHLFAVGAFLALADAAHALAASVAVVQGGVVGTAASIAIGHIVDLQPIYGKGEMFD